MNFQQLKAVSETVRRDFNLKRVADSLFISQPGVSHQIRDLEEELGIRIFERNGKRLTGTTEVGKNILCIVERMLAEAEKLRQAGNRYSCEKSGTLTIATSYSHSRRALPNAVQSFRAAYPNVRLALQHGSNEQIARWLIEGKVDVGILTDGMDEHGELATFPCESWHHIAVAPAGHALLALGREIGLADLIAHPLVTYETGFSGRHHIDAAFAAARLRPDIVLTAMDSDVILHHVALDLGVGIVAPTALAETRFKDLQAIDVSHLFAVNETRLGLRRGIHLRSYVHAFMIEFSPNLSGDDISRAVLEPVPAGEIDESSRIHGAGRT
jgi:LysR family cys regulon transcriptional activator